MCLHPEFVSFCITLVVVYIAIIFWPRVVVYSVRMRLIFVFVIHVYSCVSLYVCLKCCTLYYLAAGIIVVRFMLTAFSLSLSLSLSLPLVVFKLLHYACSAEVACIQFSHVIRLTDFNCTLQLTPASISFRCVMSLCLHYVS